MNYLKRFALMILTAVALGSVGTVTTASAATWHRGTPKALRGLYQSTTPVGKHSAAGFAPVIEIRAKTFNLGISNNPAQLMQHVKYRQAHGVYYLKGRLKKVGWVKPLKVSFGVKKKGKTIRFVSTKTYPYMGDKFKRVAHVHAPND